MEVNAQAGRYGAKRASERRSCDRFPIREQAWFRAMESTDVPFGGCGTTVNLSSRGICFRCHPAPPVGLLLEVSVNWPVPLDGGCPLKLVAIGHVVRSSGDMAALKLTRYEFRTRGKRVEQPVPPVDSAAPRADAATNRG
jgi:hypothetical protein